MLVCNVSTTSSVHLVGSLLDDLSTVNSPLPHEEESVLP